MAFFLQLSEHQTFDLRCDADGGVVCERTTNPRKALNGLHRRLTFPCVNTRRRLVVHAVARRLLCLITLTAPVTCRPDPDPDLAVADQRAARGGKGHLGTPTSAQLDITSGAERCVLISS